MAVCDNSNVAEYRRLAALILGTWLGAGVFADIAVTQNFQTVDRFLAVPGTPRTAQEIAQTGRPLTRELLRRNAGEENNFLFDRWEMAELGIGAGLVVVLVLAGPGSGVAAAATGLMLAIVGVQHFYLSPEVAALGRRIADLPTTDPLNATFWKLHGIYSGSEILKLVIGFAAAISLVRRNSPRERLG